jgi:hypothetical protein
MYVCVYGTIQLHCLTAITQLHHKEQFCLPFYFQLPQLFLYVLFPSFKSGEIQLGFCYLPCFTRECYVGLMGDVFPTAFDAP